jgi:hypothetical protein
VLGTPPAFILSQDQTLRLILFPIPTLPNLPSHAAVVKVQKRALGALCI